MFRSDIAGGLDRAYVVWSGARSREMAMSDATTAPPGRFSRPLLIAAGVIGLLLAGTAVLWAHYGTAVFFEMVAAGIAACF